MLKKPYSWSLTMDKTQLLQELSVINAALQKAYAGTLKQSVRVGGSEFNNEIRYVAPTVKDLLAERNRIQAALDSIAPASALQFQTNLSFPLVVRK